MSYFRMGRHIYGLPLRGPMQVRLLQDAEHGDWKTALARGIKGATKGQLATLVDVFANCYGVYGRIEFDGRSIDVPTTVLEEVKEDYS